MHILMTMLSIHMLRQSDRVAGLALSLLVAVGIAGCASKNPLITEPAINEPAAAAAAAEEGVQVVKKRRLFGIFSPYRVDIQQGNFVSQEMLAQLKPGMTREQVRFALGTPLLNDIFHADRWDYPFRLLKDNGLVVSSRVTVFFKNNFLERYEGGNLPTEVEYLSLLTGSKPTTPKLAPQVPTPRSSAVPEGAAQLPPVQ
jgi:outer membrane protein assembly factor BamE